MLFFAFPSHQRPGLWRSARPHGVLYTSLATLPRSYCVFTATEADHTASKQASLAFLLRSYCNHGVPAATVRRLRGDHTATARDHTATILVV
ncbi:hypothetical protein DPMN_030847 [Dreissena polymorpha]|uniref:Uncharacterized protein n=1 Tax=Dreissena polymorpha TaxID=45954 RepID=A0A9D4M1N2_DREPO|nr:hypothetical protein DPMN_030847 [Dreissena polymorpha]